MNADCRAKHFGVFSDRSRGRSSHCCVAERAFLSLPHLCLWRYLASKITVNRSIQLLSCIGLLSLTSCAPTERDEEAPILLFNGTGTSPNDVAAMETILKGKHLSYATVNSEQLNEMRTEDLLRHRLIIIPGGNYITMGNSLLSGTTTSLHDAVRGGLSYLGICAGGLLAGKAQCNSLDLTSGVRFDFYGVVNQGVHKAAVPISGVGTTAVEHYWEDGPQFTGWGNVVGTYPDGTPAIVEGTSGYGWVILCGVHPEAPESWRRGMTFSTPTSVANDYAGTLVDAALNRTRLPALEASKTGNR
jgi:glutamine amidotransferase-like uncharacterized protein